MNEITMIPVGLLEHHPENPRKDLGDLTELTASIKKNGIMQNLTVIADPETSKYLVVIGNRRLEAAKAAGLIELPCVVKDLDHREQISTMLEENMQRADLTVYEQAQGFQMMMDLGYTAKDIAEKTGFGETTVRRRIKMAEMDPKLLKKACEGKDTERQITLFDFDRLAQVDNIKERNNLLKMIGDNNFEWTLNRKLKEQRAKAVKKDALRELKEKGVVQLKEADEYSSKYERLWNDSVDLGKWKPGEKLIPKAETQLYFYLGDTDIKFYIKPIKQRAEPVKKTKAEIEKEKKIELAWKTADRIAEASAEMRQNFVEGLTVKPSNAMQMLRWALIASMSDLINHNYNTYERLRKVFELEGTYTWDYADSLQKKIMEMKQSEWPKLILIIFEGLPEKAKECQSFTSGYRGDWPSHIRNTRLEQCYAWLTEFGYQMSNEEIQMMAGTHEVFKKGK